VRLRGKRKKRPDPVFPGSSSESSTTESSTTETIPYEKNPSKYLNQTRKGRDVRQITGYDHPIKKA
jgi:hypothetical protein